MYRKAAPLVAVDTKQEAAILLERVAKRKAGKYFAKDWGCPTVPGDNIHKQAKLDPEFQRVIEHHSEKVNEMAAQMRDEYRQLKRDMDVAA